MEVCKAVNVDHGEHLKTAIKMMTVNPPDLVIMSKEGFQILAHRSILSLLSPYLCQVLSQIPGWINPSIHLPDISATTIHHFLKVLYTGVSFVSCVDDDANLAKEADSVRTVASLLGVDIQFQAKINTVDQSKPGHNSHEDEEMISKDDKDLNESEQDYDRTFYSMEEIDSSSFDHDITDSDFNEDSDCTMTYHEMPDSDFDEHSDNEEHYVTVNKEESNDTDKENPAKNEPKKENIAENNEPGNKNPAEKNEPEKEIPSEENNHSNESCQLCPESFLNKDLDEVLEHYFVHLEASLEESCGYLISQDGKCKVCLKYVNGEGGDRTVGLRHLGVDHDKLFFIFDKNGIIIPEEMFSSVEESSENDGPSHELLEIGNMKNDDPLEAINMKNDDPLQAVNMQKDERSCEPLAVDLEKEDSSISVNMEDEYTPDKPFGDTNMKNDTHAQEKLDIVNMEDDYSCEPLENPNMVIDTPVLDVLKSVNRENISRKRHLSNDSDTDDNLVPDLSVFKRQRLEEVGGGATSINEIENNSIPEKSLQSGDQNQMHNIVTSKGLMDSLLEDIIGNIVGNSIDLVVSSQSANVIENDSNYEHFDSVEFNDQQSGTGINIEVGQNASHQQNEEIDLKAGEIDNEEHCEMDDEEQCEKVDIEEESKIDERDNDEQCEEMAEIDNEEHCEEVGEIDNEEHCEEVGEIDDEEHSEELGEIDNEELIEDYVEKDEDQSDGESDIEEIIEFDPQAEEEEDDLNPTMMTNYTIKKINGFPRPVSVHILENNFNLIYILGDGHCLFRSLAHGLGYSPDMNMHLQIRQQIALEGLRGIRFYYKLSNYYLSEPNSIPAMEAYLKKILYGGATWGCNIDLAIASKLYKIDIYKLCYNSTSHKAYYSVFSAFDGELKAEQFVIIHFDDGHKGGEHYSALQKINGENERPVLLPTDSVQCWVEMPDGTGKWSRFGMKPEVVEAVEVSVDISDDSDSENEEGEDETEEVEDETEEGEDETEEGEDETEEVEDETEKVEDFFDDAHLINEPDDDDNEIIVSEIDIEADQDDVLGETDEKIEEEFYRSDDLINEPDDDSDTEAAEDESEEAKDFYDDANDSSENSVDEQDEYNDMNINQIEESDACIEEDKDDKIEESSEVFIEVDMDDEVEKIDSKIIVDSYGFDHIINEQDNSNDDPIVSEIEESDFVMEDIDEQGDTESFVTAGIINEQYDTVSKMEESDVDMNTDNDGEAKQTEDDPCNVEDEIVEEFSSSFHSINDMTKNEFDEEIVDFDQMEPLETGENWTFHSIEDFDQDVQNVLEAEDHLLDDDMNNQEGLIIHDKEENSPKNDEINEIGENNVDLVADEIDQVVDEIELVVDYTNAKICDSIIVDDKIVESSFDLTDEEDVNHEIKTIEIDNEDNQEKDAEASNVDTHPNEDGKINDEGSAYNAILNEEARTESSFDLTKDDYNETNEQDLEINKGFPEDEDVTKQHKNDEMENSFDLTGDQDNERNYTDNEVTDSITEINVDDFEVDVDVTHELLGAKESTGKKHGWMDFIGPKVKLSVEKFEKLANVFISSPNLSSPEIEDVSQSLEVSIKDGKWTFLKLKHKFQMKNKFQSKKNEPMDGSAVLDLLQTVKEANLQDDLFIF